MLSFVIAKLQAELNQLIPEHIALGPLSDYTGESLEFVVTDHGIVTLTIRDAGLELSLTAVENPLVSVQASWPVWLQWLSALDKRPPQAVKVVGQAEALETLQRWLKQYVEPEAVLAHIVGDIPASFIGAFAKNTHQWFKARRQGCQENIHAYMSDNLKVWPYGHEARVFYQAIDNLRLDVDRLSARLAQREQL